jgi:uracil phosphoribosyltransferase
MPVTVLDHPLASDLLASLRDRDTPPDLYRRLTRNLTTLLTIEATRCLPVRESRVTTPLRVTGARRMACGLAAVPILRAGLGMLDAVVDLFPDVAVGYLGLERNEQTAVARNYYSKLPHMEGRLALCLDPMLATGGSAAQAVKEIKERKPLGLVMVCVIAAPEGLEVMEREHPDVPIFTAAVDKELNAQKYILPGLGDFGDRLYGTY